MRSSALPFGGNVDDRRQRLRGVVRAVRSTASPSGLAPLDAVDGLRLGGIASRQRVTGRAHMTADGVGIAAAVQQEVLVLHVVERLGIEGHADEVEVRVEAVDLDGVLDVVVRRSVAVVIGVVVIACAAVRMAVIRSGPFCEWSAAAVWCTRYLRRPIGRRLDSWGRSACAGFVGKPIGGARRERFRARVAASPID